MEGTLESKLSVKEQIARLKAALEQQKSAKPKPVTNQPEYPQTRNPTSTSYRPNSHRIPASVYHSSAAPTFKNRTLVVNASSNPSINPVAPAASVPRTSKNKTFIANANSSQSSLAKELPQFITKGNKLIRAGVVVKKVPDLNESLTTFPGGVTKVFNKRAVISKSPHGKREILINGVEFKLDSSRRKLIRVQAQTEAASKSSIPKTPKRVMIGKRTFVRSKTGNLIPQKTQCVHYKLGKCQLGVKCPFLHDASRRLICRKYLSNVGCPNGSACQLSHSPSIHNTPICLHFMTKKGCTNTGCKYMHAMADPLAEICIPFSREGYCGKTNCKERHLWQCPDRDAGRPCGKGEKCKLPPCVLERKGIVPGDSYLTREAAAAEEETTNVAILKKPDFVTGFNPRASAADFDPNDLMTQLSSEDEGESVVGSQSEQDDDDQDSDGIGETETTNDFGDDLIEFDFTELE